MATNEELLDRLLHIADVLSSDMERYLRGHGLTTTKAHLLWTLLSKGPCRQRDLVIALGHTPRHVTTLVDELLTAGFVTRRPHPNDRRAVLVDLTPAAADLLDRMGAGHALLGRQLFGHLGGEDRLHLENQLIQLEQTLLTLVAANRT